MASTRARHPSSLRWAGYYALQRAGYHVLRLPSDIGAAHAPSGLSLTMQVRKVSSPHDARSPATLAADSPHPISQIDQTSRIDQTDT
jgi:hypothetical protein